MKVLGVEFFDGNIDESLIYAKKGGLIVAPSGPGLSKDLILSDSYRLALTKAEMVLPDSGMLCLWMRFFGKKNLRRISGLEFLEKFLQSIKPNSSCFWIMPNESQCQINLNWLREQLGFVIEENSYYNAPHYSKVGPLEDSNLLAKIETQNYEFIFIQIGGGVQERLGLYLRDQLSYNTSIICTGAALAFLSGGQIRIPKWADKFYLGWFLRCLSDPQIFIPRYLSAFRLIYLLFRYGNESPV